MSTITIAPLADAWRVHLEEIANDMVFRSGREAELAARRLAERLARAGKTSEIRIHLRDNALAGRLTWPSSTPRVPAGAVEAPSQRELEAA